MRLVLGLLLLWVRSVEGVHPYGYFEELRRISTTDRVGNVDVRRRESTDESEVAFLHVVCLFDMLCSSNTFREVAATLLAVHHFNNGIGDVASVLKDVHLRCPVRLTTEFLDPFFRTKTTVDLLSQVVNRDLDVDTLAGAIIGTRYSRTTEPASVLSSVHGIPQMSHSATSPSLNATDRHSLFARVVPSDDAAARAAVTFLQQVAESTHVAVLTTVDNFGSHLNKAFGQEGMTRGMQVRSLQLHYPPKADDVQTQLAALKNEGYRHVILETYPSLLQEVLLRAADDNLLGDDYFWMLGGYASSFVTMLEENERLLQFSNAFALISEFGADPNDYVPFDRFVQAYRSVEQVDLDFLSTRLPMAPDGSGESCLQASQDDMTNADPGVLVRFGYDTVVTLGVGACQAWNNASYFDGAAHVRGILGSEFDGATGHVSLDQMTHSRSPSSVFYSVMNVRVAHGASSAGSAEASATTTVDVVESIALVPYNVEDDCTAWKIEELRPFVFADGSTKPPSPLPPVEIDMHYIGGLAIFGYIICAIGMMISLSCAYCVFRYRETRAIRASQPVFLVMVCVGCLLMSAVVIPLSMDDEHSNSGSLEIACMSQPWLFSLGLTSFSALISKTWRIQRLARSAHRFRHLALKEKDVLAPFFVLAGLNIAVLILWTIMAPRHFVREPGVGSDEWGRSLSSIGSCHSIGREDQWGSEPFAVSVVAINFFAVVLANIQAYSARGLRTEYNESSSIGLIMVVLLQTWLTSLPILALVYEDPEASYMAKAVIAVASSMTIVLIIFIPKIRSVNENIRSLRVDRNSSEEGLQVFRVRLQSETPDQSSTETGCVKRHSISTPEGLTAYLRRSSQKTRHTIIPELSADGLDDVEEEEGGEELLDAVRNASFGEMRLTEDDNPV